MLNYQMNSSLGNTNTYINEENYQDEQSSDSSHYEGNQNMSLSESIVNKRKERLSKLKNKVKIFESKNEWYEGEVDKLFCRQGYGVYYYSVGDVYEGEFEKGVRSGKGDYFFADGARFTGEWLMDKKNGFGSYKYGNYEFNGQWENDTFVSGFAFKINTEDKEVLGQLDKEDEEDSETFSYRNISYSNSRVSSPKHQTKNNSISKDEDETGSVKTFYERREKKIFNLHKVSGSIDVDLVNFKSNTGDINIIKRFLSSHDDLGKGNQRQGFHTQNNSTHNCDFNAVTPFTLYSKPVSKVNSNNNSECQFGTSSRSMLKNYSCKNINLLKDMDFKCKNCIYANSCNTGNRNTTNVVSSSNCSCKKINEYTKNYYLSEEQK